MKTSEGKTDERRLQRLRQILERERTQAYERIRQLRSEQQEDSAQPPGDELDEARSLAEVETYAGLIERAEFNLKAIDAALNRLEHHLYGICEECGEAIPVERLEALPFAAYCVDCQSKQNNAPQPGQGSIDEASRKLWVAPANMAKSPEMLDELVQPEDRLFVHDKKPFGSELGEFEQLPPAPTAGRRGRIKQRKE